MKEVINIPNVSRDDRIGSAFKHLFAVIERNSSTPDKEIVWDFKASCFYHPFFLFPLSVYKSICEKQVSCMNISPMMASYFRCVRFMDMLDITDDDSLTRALDEYLDKSYIPICRFSRTNDNIDSMQTIIQRVIERQKSLSVKFRTPISYLISELVCNIQQHSNGAYGYIYAQYLKSDNSLNICIADNGITVYGSYVKTGKYLDKIDHCEANALKLANEGYSTKNLPNAENRGYGISSSKKMIVEGMGGDFFMLSGGAFHRHDRKESVYIELPDAISWNGTITLLRIPLSISDNFDYYRYIR